MRIMSVQSGTSADGIDVAVVDIAVDDGDRTALVLTPVSFATVEWPEPLRARILRAMTPKPVTMAEVNELNALLGRQFGAAAMGHGAGGVDLVVSHGQTVHHWVDGGVAAGTLQLGEPAWIAEATGAPVLANLRAADIAAGGQGAPLMGIFDRLWLQTAADAREAAVATVNLGGIANVSMVEPGGRVTAWDTGPGNCLIDAVTNARTGGRLGYDRDGALAAAGTVDEALLERLMAHPYLEQEPPKSTGRETFTLDFVEEAIRAEGYQGLELADVVATLTEFTAATLAESLSGRPAAPVSVIASGGGVHNPSLMESLKRRTGAHGVELTVSAHHGLDPDAKENYLFALIGFHSWHGIASTLPDITGARRPVMLGQLVPAAVGLKLPEPLPPFRRLTVNLIHR
ncbi:anhydro-N-acetylmuramic acid kinase [Arthrobacter castelli]|uniref:anhydro-N-acetylmuramic acid kinase n=1 Tax=Arthrobacter castelli TaxID=271431 RepID=UPI0003F746A2|nr:anhydro-N-acetylmuramic acid kinase [Arthrobacter castelli]